MKAEYRELKDVCKAMRRLPSRYRRKVASALRQALRSENQPTIGNRLARHMLGVTGSHWLSVSESLAKMRAHGMVVERKFFYRLAKKTALTPKSRMTIYLDEAGDYGPKIEESRSILKLEIKVSKRSGKLRVKCRVQPVCSKIE